MLDYEYDQIRKRLCNLAQTGTLENTSDLINSYFSGTCSPVTVRRKITGIFAWTMRDAIALQAGSMNFTVNKLMLGIQHRLETEAAGGRKKTKPSSPAEMGARFSVEAGEATASLIRARESRLVGDFADAINEIDDVIAVTSFNAFIDLACAMAWIT